MGLDGFWHVIQQFRLLSLKDPGVMEKLDLFSLPYVGSLIQLCMGVVCES